MKTPHRLNAPQYSVHPTRRAEDWTHLDQVSQADDDYAFRNGRATDMLKRWPDPGRSAWCLGTPHEELGRAGRLARFERRIAKPLIWFVLLAWAAIIGFNVRQQLHEAHAAAPPAIRDGGRETMLCKNDWRERCLVCTHRNTFGDRTVSTHC